MGCCGWNEVHKVPTVPTMSTPSDPRHLIALHRARAEVALEEVAGGGPLCRVSGADLVPVKRAEGRLAALAELQRALRTSEAPVSAVVEQMRGQWAQRRHDVAARGPAWEAYLEGGIVEIEAVARDLEAH
jgi:hypothetical protein